MTLLHPHNVVSELLQERIHLPELPDEVIDFIVLFLQSAFGHLAFETVILADLLHLLFVSWLCKQCQRLVHCNMRSYEQMELFRIKQIGASDELFDE